MRVILGIPSQQIIMRDFTLDATLSDANIMQYLKTQSTKLFGHPAEKLCLDYEIQINEDKNNKKIRSVAAHRSNIYFYRDLFLAAKIPLHAIDVDALALERFTNTLLPIENNVVNQTRLSMQEMASFSVAFGLCLWRNHEY